MSYTVGHDGNWNRDIGYAVPAYCDHPECNKEIDRGLGHVCGGEPHGGERGCGLFFCADHLHYHAGHQLCDRCQPRVRKPFHPKPDHPEWTYFKMTDASWAEWRKQNGYVKRTKP